MTGPRIYHHICVPITALESNIFIRRLNHHLNAFGLGKRILALPYSTPTSTGRTPHIFNDPVSSKAADKTRSLRHDAKDKDSESSPIEEVPDTIVEAERGEPEAGDTIGTRPATLEEALGMGEKPMSGKKRAAM